jgi:DNA repair protein RecO (recombination protein O)
MTGGFVLYFEHLNFGFMRTYATQGIILNRRNFSEADRILTVFTRNHGKLVCLAKGIRRPSSRKRGHLELFNHSKLFLARGRSFDILTQADTLNDFTSWRSDLTTVSRAYQLTELIDRLTAEQQDHPAVFHQLHLALSQLHLISNWDQFYNRFTYQLLQELGFWPRVNLHSSVSPSQVLNHLLPRPLNSSLAFSSSL